MVRTCFFLKQTVHEPFLEDTTGNNYKGLETGKDLLGKNYSSMGKGRGSKGLKSYPWSLQKKQDVSTTGTHIQDYIKNIGNDEVIDKETDEKFWKDLKNGHCLLHKNTTGTNYPST